MANNHKITKCVVSCIYLQGCASLKILMCTIALVCVQATLFVTSFVCNFCNSLLCADKSTEDSGEENNGKVIKSTQGNTIINKYITTWKIIFYHEDCNSFQFISLHHIINELLISKHIVGFLLLLHHRAITRCC